MAGRSIIDDPVTVNGRQTTRAEAILTALREGNSTRQAHDHIGVPGATYHRWLQLGADYQAHLDAGGRPRPTQERYREFSEQVKQARAEGEGTFTRALLLAALPRPVERRETGWREVVVNRLSEAGEPFQEVVRVQINKVVTVEEFDWRAAQAALKMQYGWKEPVAVEHSGPEGEPIEVRGIPHQQVGPEAEEAFKRILVRAHLATAEDMGLDEDTEVAREQHDDV